VWFKKLAENHPNTSLQMNVQKIDTIAANEESKYSSKLEDTLLSKEVILPVVGFVILVVVIWAIVTRCGKRSCCKKNPSQMKSEVETRKSVLGSVKSTSSDVPNDLESGSQFSDGIPSQPSSNAGTFNQDRVGVSKLDLEMVNTIHV